MKKIFIILICMCLICACGKQDVSNNEKKTVVPSSEAIYMNLSFEDIVKRSDVVVLAEYVEKTEDNNMTEFLFNVREVLCGEVGEEQIHLCTFPGTGYIEETGYSFETGQEKYEKGGQYILILERDSFIFYDYDRYQEAGDLFLEPDSGKFFLNGVKINAESTDSLLDNIRKLYNESEHDKNEKKHYDSEFDEMLAEADTIAVVKVLSEGTKAEVHNGVRYDCSIEEIIKGKEVVSQNGSIVLVLEEGKVKKDGSYIIGFSAADPDSPGYIYVQEVLGTILENSDENRVKIEKTE